MATVAVSVGSDDGAGASDVGSDVAANRAEVIVHGQAVIAIDGSVVAVKTGANALGVDGAPAAGVSADEGVGCSDGNVDSGVRGIWDGQHSKNDSCCSGEECFHWFGFLSVWVPSLGPGEGEEYSAGMGKIFSGLQKEVWIVGGRIAERVLIRSNKKCGCPRFN